MFWRMAGLSTASPVSSATSFFLLVSCAIGYAAHNRFLVAYLDSILTRVCIDLGLILCLLGVKMWDQK